MSSQEQADRILKFIVIAIVIMIFVMSILLVVVYKLSPVLSGTNAVQTVDVDGTVAALVATSLQTTPTPLPPLADVATIEVISQEEAEPEMAASSTLAPTPTLSATPLPAKTPIAWVEDLLDSMSLPQKVGQMILTGVVGTELTSDTCQFIKRVSPGGIVYLGSNISSPYTDQLAALSAGLQNCIANGVGIPLLIAIDHEGYYVDRFPYDSQMTTFPPAMAFGATRNPDLAYQAALAAGLELRTNGVNMVLGPVADVLTDYDNTVISQRSFGGDPQAVGLMVSEAVRGYLAAGVLPVLKHYPGHGGVSGDSHAVLPVDNATREQLFTTHLVPFQAGIAAGAPSVMVSHVAFPEIDSEDLPASLSKPLYDILVDDLDFQGIAMSDSMGMGAVTSTGLGVSGASVVAIKAGLDMLLLVSPDLAETVYGDVLWAAQSGDIPLERINQAVRNILTVKYLHGLADAPLPAGTSPDWQADANLAFQIGYQAVSVYKDGNNLVPLPAEVQDVLVVGPADGWGLYPKLQNALDQMGINYSIMTYSGYWYGPIPETGYLQTVPASAGGYDLVIVFTWDSRPNQFIYGDTFQEQLVNSLLDRGHSLMVIALKSPTDILDFPRVRTYLATMGTTSGQLQALVDILVGESSPSGVIPLPNLP
jgi:beta-N-acetylhexosaminidase